MSIWDDIGGSAEAIVDVAGNAESDLPDGGADVFEGPGNLVGIVVSGAALYVMGPGAVIPAFVAGAAAGNALIKHRVMSDDERRFAETVFGKSLPANDKIVLTNLLGHEGQKFTCPNTA